MDFDTSLYYLRLIESRLIPLPAISKLLRAFGSGRKLAALPRASLLELGFHNAQIDLLQNQQSKNDSQPGIDRSLEWANRDGNHLVHYESSAYPGLLREIDAAPPILFVRGSISTLSGRHFAMVGSRRATHYGKRNAYFMAQQLSKAGLQICSGLAAGIDSKAHEGALDAEKRTLAVIGTGIDRVYPPQNQMLAERIVENGALVSEFAMGTPPYPGNFPRRNRIISGLAVGTLVVEANIKSGSLITARLAMEQNRDVFALPGPVASPQSRGCHTLIKQGAKLVEEPADILEEIGISTNLPDEHIAPFATGPKGKIATTAESRAMNAIDHQGSLFQTILDAGGFTVQELNAQLIHLEAAGIIRQEGGRYFKIG